MYAFAEKTNSHSAVKRKSGPRRKKSEPLYVYRDIAGQEQAKESGKGSGVGTVVQRYEVELVGGSLVCTTGRPRVPNSPAFLLSLYDRIANGSQDVFERDFIQNHQDRDKGAWELSNKGGYRSAHGLAFCHKVSIDDVERILVDFANGKGIGDAFVGYLREIGINAGYWLKVIQEADPEGKKGLVNRLIEVINETPANYYLGDASANSSIQQSADPHYDMDGNASPISGYMLDNYEDMGITAPKDDGAGGFASSSFGRYWK